MKDYYSKLVNQQNMGVENKLNQPDEEEGLIITPIPFCSIKTKYYTDQKIFINISHHDKIETPKEEHILEIDNQFGIRLPMSLSEKYEDFNVNSQICQVM
jgi:hypothetical protein